MQVLKDLSLSFPGFQDDEIKGWIIRPNPIVASKNDSSSSESEDNSLNLHITYTSSNLFLLLKFMSSSANPISLVGHQLVYPNFFLPTLLPVCVESVQTISNKFF